MITIYDADVYFSENVLHSSEWTDADTQTKQRALNNAKKVLYRAYKNYNEVNRPIPNEAIYLQALYLLKMDDAILKSQMGVKSMSIKGVGISVEKADIIAPEVRLSLGRKVGRYYSL